MNGWIEDILTLLCVILLLVLWVVFVPIIAP